MLYGYVYFWESLESYWSKETFELVGVLISNPPWFISPTPHDVIVVCSPLVVL